MEALTLAGVMDQLDRQGFTEHFTPAEGGLRAVHCGRIFPPSQLTITEYQRFEGVSDPDDMAILYAIETRSGISGTLADAFGVYSDPAVSAVIEDVALASRPG
jgi:hypothetical protein